MSFTEMEKHDRIAAPAAVKPLRLAILGLLTLLAFGTSIMTTIILAAGRQGKASDGLSILSIDTGDFARFHPVQIHLVDKDTAEKMIRRFDLGQSLNEVGNTVNGIVGDPQGTLDDLTDQAGAVTEAVKNKASDLVDEVGDKISDVREVIEQFIVKVLGTIEKELNEWIKQFADYLGNLDIAQRYSLHVMTFCQVPRSNFSSTSPESYNTTGGDATCTYLTSGSDQDEFNATQNDGRLLGFPPGKITAEVLNLFLIPKEVQDKVREPIDNTADGIQKLLHDAKADLKRWTKKLTFTPIVVFYAFACACSWALFVLLLADAAYLWFRKQVLLITKWPYRILSVIAVFSIFMGTLIVVIIGAIAKVINVVAANVFKITVTSGSGIKTMSWLSLIFMVVVTIGVYLPSFITDSIHFTSNLPKSSKRLMFWKRGRGEQNEIPMQVFKEHE